MMKVSKTRRGKARKRMGGIEAESDPGGLWVFIQKTQGQHNWQSRNEHQTVSKMK